MMVFSNKKTPVFQKVQLYLTTVSLGIVLLTFFTIIYNPVLHHDVAQYLTAGQMFIGGAWPYVDIIDTNLPMIIYINAIPAAFSKLTHVPLVVAGILLFYVLTIITMLILGKILRVSFPELTRQKIQFIYIVWLFIALFSYRIKVFGQREQLIFLFLAPFLALRNARYMEVKIPLLLSITTTFFAFCAVAIKPFYILPVLIIEAIQMGVHRCFLKPFIFVETLMFFSLSLLYMVHFYFFPGMSSFYDYWLIFMIRGYKAYEVGVNRIIIDLLYNPSIYMFCFLAFFLCFIYLYKKNSLFLLSSCFGWFACCTLVLFLWQAKGWPYQLLPFYYSTIIGIALAFIATPKPFVKELFLCSIIFTGASFLIMFDFNSRVFTLQDRTLRVSQILIPKNKLTNMIESLTTPNDRVLFLSTSVDPGFPALTYTERMPGSRFLIMFPIAFFFKHSINYVPEKSMRDDEVMFYEMLKKDVTTLKPKLVFITIRDNLQVTPSYFKITEYLKKRGFYINILSAYHNIGQLNCEDGEIFEVWLYNEN